MCYQVLLASSLIDIKSNYLLNINCRTYFKVGIVEDQVFIVSHCTLYAMSMNYLVLTLNYIKHCIFESMEENFVLKRAEL